jgi:nicotinate-nucleotide adenylyltransferase
VVLVLGADAARSLPSWHRADELASLVTVAVVGRAGDEPVEVVGFRSIKIDVSRVDVSSSEIRDRIRNGRPVDGLVPPTVIHELRARRLYTR